MPTPVTTGLAKSATATAQRRARRRIPRRLRQTEVQHLHRAVVAHLDVGGLQIAMDDALFVGPSIALAICRAMRHFVDRNGPCAIPLREVGPVDQLHDQRANGSPSSRP